MNKEKEINKSKNSKYFPEEYVKDYCQDLDELIKEKKRLKKELGVGVGIRNVFSVLNYSQKNYYYQMKL